MTVRQSIRACPVLARPLVSLSLLLAIVTLVAPGASGDETALDGFRRPGPFPVGVRTVVVEDPSRNDSATGGKRTLVTEIWYPAVDGSRTAPRTQFREFFGKYTKQAREVLKTDLDKIESRFTTLAARDVRLRRPPGRHFPLILFSHGNGGFRHQNVFQMDHLASHGYVVAAPDHTGNSLLSPLPSGAVRYNRRGRRQSSVNRPNDLSFLIEWFRAESARTGSWLHRAIDTEGIGVIGHSFGGFTACKVASTDPRIKAIVPMTVAIAGLDAPPANVPTMVFLGTHDRTIGTVGNMTTRGYYFSCPAEKYLVELKRGGHFSFCEMALINPEFGDGIGREAKLGGKKLEFLSVPLAKEIINAYTLVFFDRVLRGNSAASKFLTRNRYPEEVDYKRSNGEASLVDESGG